MTIAVCFLTNEGVVFGADSTTTTVALTKENPAQFHFLNHQQKIFEIGQGGSLGVLQWGLSRFGDCSLRTLFAKLHDEHTKAPPPSVAAVATRLAALINESYYQVREKYADSVSRFSALDKRRHFDGMHTLNDEEKQDWARLRNFLPTLEAGFFVGGYVDSDRTPRAFSIKLTPLSVTAEPEVEELKEGVYAEGEQWMAQRILRGFDDRTASHIEEMAKLRVSAREAEELVYLASQAAQIRPYALPIREASDFVHWVVATTIKAVKFSSKPLSCGGPVEVALVTSDREFRWLNHKPQSSAILEGSSR